MEEFFEQLKVQGVHHDTCNFSTRRGSDTEGHPSRWKTYYRSSTFPDFGVLLAHENADTGIKTTRSRLDEEAGNYRRLHAEGYDVPATAECSLEVIDHFAGGILAAALIVEHVDGRGPYKARTDFRTIARIVRAQDPSLEEQFLNAWARLQAAAARRAPQDLQVILANDGRILTIDPEKIGPALPLNDLP